MKNNTALGLGYLQLVLSEYRFKQQGYSYWIFSLLLLFGSSVQTEAAGKTPNEVYSGIEYANRLIDRLLFEEKQIEGTQAPLSREKAAKPMHVYELHVSALAELYSYALANNRRPPPLAVSTPIPYTPTDVYYLTEMVVENLESIYTDSLGGIDFFPDNHSGKTPGEVYQVLFELYYKLNLLNGKSKISPNEVFAHAQRAKEDLQYSLLTISKRLPDAQEEKKRMLVTAIYGMHPNGSTLAKAAEGRKPLDVINKAFDVRKKLNQLRLKNKLGEIQIPSVSDYGSVKPIDVFLQTQFIIAELNLLKSPLDITSTTNAAKPVTGRTPTDVYQEMAHIEYMLGRLHSVL